MAAGRPPHVIAEDHSFSPCRHACYKRPSGDLYDGKIKRSRDDEILAVLRRFEDDQSMLRRRVEVNEMKIAELRAANDYLLTQNAQLRLTTVQCSRIVNPVTVTQTVTSTGQSLQPQVINTVSMAPIQALQVDAPIVTVATPQNLLENISTLSTSTQLTGQLAGQQISQIHVGPAISAPSMGLTINTINTSQAISNATQPIISYPIMTHSTLASILPH